jgi:hypothetical protein
MNGSDAATREIELKLAVAPESLPALLSHPALRRSPDKASRPRRAGISIAAAAEIEPSLRQQEIRQMAVLPSLWRAFKHAEPFWPS